MLPHLTEIKPDYKFPNRSTKEFYVRLKELKNFVTPDILDRSPRYNISGLDGIFQILKTEGGWRITFTSYDNFRERQKTIDLALYQSHSDSYSLHDGGLMEVFLFG